MDSSGHPGIAGRSPILFIRPDVFYRRQQSLMKRRIYCTVPQALIKEPILFTIGSRFSVIPNLRGASVTEEIAVLTLELEGDEDNIKLAIDYLRESGVTIEDLDSDQ